MELALSFDQADALRIEKYAAARNMSVLDYVKRAVKKTVDEETERAAQNVEYLAMLDEGYRDMEEGKGTLMTWEELEALRQTGAAEIPPRMEPPHRRRQPPRL